MPSRRRVPFDPRQLSLGLDDGPPPYAPPSEDSVFFAILPDRLTAAGIARFAQMQGHRYGLLGTQRRAETLHVSLLGLGNYEKLPGRVIDAVKRAAATVRAAPFLVAFDRAMNFTPDHKGNYPIVLCGGDGIVGILRLHEALHEALAGEGFKLGALSEFKPHVTLLYGPKSVPEIFLDEPLNWTVSDFVLVHSFHGESRYEILGRWPLGGARGDR